MKLIGLIQWISTAFMIVLVISWWSVGDPSVAVSLLWDVQHLLVENAADFANNADITIPTLEDDSYGGGYDFAEEVENYDFPNDWVTERRPLGKPVGVE